MAALLGLSWESYRDLEKYDEEISTSFAARANHVE